MADVDPEVERLADALARTPASVAPTQTDMARMILADLRERYVLVPREGGDPEFGVRMDYAHPFVEQGAVLRAVDQEHADLIAESWGANEWEHTIVCRVRGPWEPADAPLSAQNGPDDSQGTDAHPENPR